MSICEIFPLIAEYTSQGKEVVMVTELGKVQRRSVFVDSRLVLGTKDHERYVALLGKERRIEVVNGDEKIVVERIDPRPSIILVGSGVIAKEIYRLAKSLGFIVAVVAEDAREDDFPEANLLSNSGEVLGQIAKDSFVVIANEGGKPYDIPFAYIALKGGARYVGFLSSQKRAAYTIAQLIKMGVPIEELKQRFYAPLGLDLNAKTAEEIALSALAEVVKLLRGGSGKHLREVKDPYKLVDDALQGKIEDNCNFVPKKVGEG